MHFTLPELPYDYDELEPYIDATTMTIHHDKHHGGYVAKLNSALEQTPSHHDMPLTELLQNLDELPKSVLAAIKNNGGGHYNHSLFWRIIAPDGGGTAPDALETELSRDFQSFELFKKTFAASAMSLFGSGWTWLCNDINNRLVIINTANQDTPLTKNLVPILCIDLWEHAYYLNYQNRRASYIDAFWNVVHWEQVLRNLEETRKHTVLAIH